MDDQLYREIILDHWKNPQNYGVLENADIDITNYNPLCGDEVRLTICLEKFVFPDLIGDLEGNGRSKRKIPGHAREDKIAEIKFFGRGCAISQASASILTELAKTKTIGEIRVLGQQQYLENLSIQLTPARLKCALLPYSTLQKALTLGNSDTTIKL